MLKISPSAATFISQACDERDLGDGSGMRIFPSADPQDHHKLRLRYVPGPEADDVVVHNGDARVFLAEEIVSVVARLRLDTTNGLSDADARLVLRNGS